MRACVERRARVEAALRAGESVKVIAGRELVSQRWVFRVQAEMRAAEPSPLNSSAENVNSRG